MLRSIGIKMDDVYAMFVEDGNCIVYDMDIG